MSTKQINTLIEDLNRLLLSGEGREDEKLTQISEEFGKRMTDLFLRRVLSFGEKRESTLRMSNIGKPDTQLWFDLHGYEKHENLTPSAILKFMYGDVIEELVLSLCEAAGHTVERRQEEVELEGILGHIDAIIDGELVDVKSASSYSFERFKDGSLKDNDSFGYIMQLSGYAEALGKPRGYFLAMDKTLGHTTLMESPALSDMAGRIRKIKEMLACDTPPIPKCSIKVEKNGNEYLGSPCSYCAFKHHCNPNLRTFVYSTGPRFFTKVVSEPRVLEVYIKEAPTDVE